MWSIHHCNAGYYILAYHRVRLPFSSMAANGLVATRGCLYNQKSRTLLFFTFGCSSQLCILSSSRSPGRSHFRVLAISGQRVYSPVRCGLAAGAEQPPSSREDAVLQAGASVAALLEKSLKRQGALVKQRKDQRQLRLRVEIPVADESPSSVLALSLDLISAFASGKKGLVTDIGVCFANASLLELGSRDGPPAAAVPRLHFLSLEEAAATLPKECSCLFVIAPRLLNAAEVATLVTHAGVRPLVVVNPDWPEEQEEYSAWKPLLSSFEVAFSFTVICIQGMFQKTEGAILKHVKSGAPSGRPWLIFVKESDKYKCVASLKSRPDAAELESALYNFIAANSPITRSVSFLRGLVTRK